MEYIIITSILFICMLIYFRIANKYNIIDKPNHRSSHTEITLRGGGVIYPITLILFLFTHFFYQKNIIYPFNYIIFSIGMLSICTISFLDDLKDLSNKIRLIFHFLSVTFLMFFTNTFNLLPAWSIPFLYILIIGILNAYNFMDGINGMTGLYSIIVLGTLIYINQFIISFIDINFIVYPALATFVFLFFNFRKKAKCFMGDIGSMGIAFWIITLITLLIIKTENIKYLLFLTIYGIETVFTIIERLKLKENIFRAHKRHLFQLLVNEKKQPHTTVSFIYAITQLLLNILIMKFNILILLFIILLLTIFYLTLKKKIRSSIETK